jgi:hypothetical protein
VAQVYADPWSPQAELRGGAVLGKPPIFALPA